MSLEIPTIHLNGTNKNDLLEAIEEAHLKVREAIKALAETGPNGRDYYLKPLGVTHDRLTIAIDEHSARVTKLLQVQHELEELAEGIAAQ